MSASALKIATESRLRVRIVAPSAERRDALEKIVRDLGHVVVAENQADLVLTDGETITIGDGEVESGVLLHDASAVQIDAALRAVAAGLTVGVHAHSHLSELVDEESERNSASLLTPRELQILSAIGRGSSNKEIARQLSISLHTVKFHVESLFRKLRVRSRAEAVARGLERRRNIVDV